MRIWAYFFIASFMSSLIYTMEHTKEEYKVPIVCSDGIEYSTCADLISKLKVISVMLDDIGNSIVEQPIPLLTSSQQFNTFTTLAKKEKNELAEALIFLSIKELNELGKLTNYIESEDFKQKIFEALANNIILFGEAGSLADWDELIVKQMIEKFSHPLVKKLEPLVKKLEQPDLNGAHFTLFNIVGNHLKKIFDETLEERLIFSICLSPDKTYIAVGLKNIIRLYNAKTINDFHYECELSYPADQIYSLCFNPSIKLLASASCCPYQVKLWDLNTKKIIQNWESSNPVRSLCWDSKGELLAAGTEEGAINIWNIKNKDTIITLPTNLNINSFNRIIWSIDFSPNRQHLASGCLDHIIRIWDIKTQECVATLVGHTGCINTICYSPNGKYIASAASDESAKIWDSATGRLLITLTFKRDKKHFVPLSPHSLCWSPDSNYIAASSFDNRIRLWNIRVLTTLYKLQTRLKANLPHILEKKECIFYNVAPKLGSLGTIFKTSSLSVLMAGIYHQLMWEHKEPTSVYPW